MQQHGMQGQTSSYQIQSQRKFSLPRTVLFCLLAFPLGLFCFLLIVIGLAVGMATSVIGIGLLFLFLTFLAARGLGSIERGMATLLLDLPPRPPTSPLPAQTGFFRRFGVLLGDPYTWTSLVYMLLIKLPLGVVSFALALALPLLSLALTFLPLIYLLNLLINLILLWSGIHSNSYLVPGFIEIHQNLDLGMFLRSFVGVPVGLILSLCTWFILRAFKWLWFVLIRYLLSN